MKVITIENLRCQVGEKTILDCPGFIVEAGQRWELSGPNGSGKTTLLKSIAGLRPVTTGRLERNLALTDIIYVHQHPYFFRGSVLDNLSYGLKIRKKRLASPFLLEVLAAFGLKEAATRKARSLSGGEGRKLALARALILEPALLLLDEPTAELDEAGIAQARLALERFSGALVIAAPAPLPAGFAHRRLELSRPG